MMCSSGSEAGAGAAMMRGKGSQWERRRRRENIPSDVVRTDSAVAGARRVNVVRTRQTEIASVCVRNTPKRPCYDTLWALSSG